MKDESLEKKKVIVVKKKVSIPMKKNNKPTENQKKYEQMQNSESKGLGFNKTEEISDTNMRSNYKKIEKALNNFSVRKNSNCPNVLYVESKTDKVVYEKFTNNGNTFIKPIKPETDIPNDDFIIIGNAGKRCSYKDAIIDLVARNASLKNSQKPNSPYYPQKTFYGIVDMDYDKDDREIKIVCEKIKEQYDICKKQLSTTSPANDVETLMFKFKENEILSLCLNNYVPYQYKKPIQEFWKQLIETAKQKASKLGAMRKKSATNSRKNELIENGKNNRYVLAFSYFFPKYHPEKYSDYANSEYEDTILEEIIKKDIAFKKETRKNLSEETALKDMENARNNLNALDLWSYCRGHDFTGILSCLIKKEMLLDKSEKKIEAQLMNDIISLITPNDFDGVNFKEFIKKNNL